MGGHDPQVENPCPAKINYKLTVNYNHRHSLGLTRFRHKLIDRKVGGPEFDKSPVAVPVLYGQYLTVPHNIMLIVLDEQ